ncbi:LysR substrate-binding domain-containing protein [Microvirga alba]|uniref:LysR family transcriptional regulator n=1 Tax=Microvirga alba TaxID=2791025 RepID=A0A931BRT4_9HYPH|nr:LysR substrate-binding domain-containing protein [Microvirga alba]MBF9235751.1 LysR family transcriptional regulator [Microvirga alba]
MQKINLIDISRLDLNLAVTFLAIWQERSVSKAAVRLSLSQSAVSAALTRLREAAGDPLFVRMRGGMEPTPRAIDMANKMEDGVALIRGAFLLDRNFDPARSDRHFSFGMSDDFELAVGPTISRRLQAEAPGISIVFRQTNRHTVEQMLDAGEIDLAITSGAPQRSWLVQDHVSESGYACLLDPRRCKVSLPLSLEDYLALPHVLVSYSGRDGIVDTGLKSIGRMRRVHTALTHFSALPSFLMAMEAVATLPAHAAASLAIASSLEVSPVPIDLGRYPVSIVSRRASAADSGIEWMTRLVREALLAVPLTTG